MSCDNLSWGLIALNMLKRAKDDSLCKAIGPIKAGGLSLVCGSQDYLDELDRRALCSVFCCCLKRTTPPIKQRCVAAVLWNVDGYFNYQGYYKAEVPYDQSGVAQMSSREAMRATRSRPPGSRIPDVVIVKDPSNPSLDVGNIHKAYEMKFPGDSYSNVIGPDGMTQYEAYQELFKGKIDKEPMTAGTGKGGCNCKDDDGDDQKVLERAFAWQTDREKAISLTERTNADTAAAVGALAGATPLGRAAGAVGGMLSALARVLGF